MDEHGSPPFGRRNAIRLLLLGSGVSLLGDGLFAIAMAFGVFALGGDVAQLGVIVGIGMLTVFLCILPAGTIADRASRKWIATGSDLLRAGAQLTSAVLVLSDASSAWYLLFPTVVFCIGTALHQPATVGFVAEVVPEARLVQVNGTIQGLRGLTMVVGSALGGWLVDAAGAGQVLLVDAATFLVCAIAFSLVVPRPNAPHEQTAVRVRDSFTAARAQPWILPGILLIAGFVFAMLAPMQIVGPAIAEERGSGASLWGAISTALAIGLVLGGGAAAFGKVRSPLPVAGVLLLLGATGHLLLAADAPLAAVLPGYAALGAAMGVYGANWEATKQRLVPRHVLSRIGALDWFFSLIGGMTGVAVASVVITFADSATMLRVMAAATLLLVVAMFALRSLAGVLRAPAAPLPVPG